MVTKETIQEVMIIEVTRPTKTGFEKVLSEQCQVHNTPKLVCGCKK